MEIRCPVCGRAFISDKSFFGHLRHHSMWERMAAATAPLPGNGGSSSVDVVAVPGAERSERKDLLPGPIKTGKRSSSSSRALVVVPQPNPPPLERTGMELVVSDFGSWDLMDLPLKKRILIALKARDQNQYICIVCGRVFPNFRSLGGHKAHHTIKEKKKRARAAEDADKDKYYLEAGGNRAVVVYKPPPPAPMPRSYDVRQCLKCGRAFASGQALGGHKQHCKGPPAPAEREGGAIQHLDLNKVPQPEEEEGLLALPWYADK
ncbi:UNVERIFIED_CONTAM: Zinc finger protein 36 [Sesamum indicum]